jgi:hypothetical protein
MSESNGARVLWSGSIASDPEINQLLHPSRFYARPADVAGDQLLTVEERRAILSSWASDACAVDSNPALRQPPHANGPRMAKILERRKNLYFTGRSSLPERRVGAMGSKAASATSSISQSQRADS